LKKNKDGKLVSPLGIVQPFDMEDAVDVGQIVGDLGAVGVFTGEGQGQKDSTCKAKNNKD